MTEPYHERAARPENPRLSVVIACYRDAPAIPHMYARLTQTFATLPVVPEFIFVNDASPDDTEAVLRDLARRDPRVVAITHSRNFGSQAAFTSGMQRCTGDMVVLMDGDLQDPPELIAQFFEKWREGYDVVYGVRVKREASRFLRVAYKLFYRVFRALSYVDVPRDAGDFSLMDRRVVTAINAMGERDRFLRGLRAWVGFRQVGVPYVRPERMFGVTTNNLRKNLAWARKGIFSFSFVPLEVIFYLALAVSGLAGLMLAIYVVLYLRAGAPTGFMTLLTLILLMGSLQFLCLAVIGDYVGRVLEEVKQRPHFLVKSVLNDPRERAPIPRQASEPRPAAGPGPWGEEKLDAASGPGSRGEEKPDAASSPGSWGDEKPDAASGLGPWGDEEPDTGPAGDVKPHTSPAGGEQQDAASGPGSWGGQQPHADPASGEQPDTAPGPGRERS